MHKLLCCSNKHGRKSKFKWPDTFLIESSGRRETPESIAEAKAKLAKRHNATLARQHSAMEEDEEDEAETDTEMEHKGAAAESSSDTTDDEEFDDTFYASTF